MLILLDYIVARFKRPCHLGLTDVPASVYEVKILLSSSELRSLVNMLPVDILMIGEMQYCEDTNRAKALMSALSVTAWYNESALSDKAKDPKHLVFRKYPLSFLRECR